MRRAYRSRSPGTARVSPKAARPGGSPSTSFAALTARVRGEFAEMPGLRLTARQAQLLFGLDRALCERILRCAVSDGWLVCTPAGLYHRSDG